jgi:hypothetical protein
MTFKLIKMTNCSIRERPALFSSPYWQDKLLVDKTEEWRDQRKKYSTWQIGIWTTDYNIQEVIGLLVRDYPTHYAFYLRDVLENPRTKDGIHFDAGTSRTELFIEPAEWERVLNELDTLSRYPSLHEETEQEAQGGTTASS